MKNILIPIDIDKINYTFIDNTINFFKNEKCSFYFLNTYYYNISGFNSLDLLQIDKDWFEKSKNKSEEKLENIVSNCNLKNTSKKHTFIAISKSGKLIIELKKAILSYKIDLVIIPIKNKTESLSSEYSNNVKSILEDLRECPVILIPEFTQLNENYEFVLASNFEFEIPENEIKHWCKFVKIARGSIRIIALTNKNGMTKTQLKNQHETLVKINKILKISTSLEYFSDILYLKNFIRGKLKQIICLVDEKPNFWRNLGFSNSKIINFGPFNNTPLIKLNR